MEQVLDREGRALTIREVTSSDEGAIEALLSHLSPRSTRQRFLSTTTQGASEYVQALADPLRTLDALVVESCRHVVAVGSTHQLPDGTVEFAVAVDDDDQGRGIGTALVEALVAKTRERGVSAMVGTVLGGNVQMFDVLRHLGLTWHSVVEDGAADVVLILGDDTAYAASHEVREQLARAAAIRPLLAPAGVAVLDSGAHPRARLLARAGRPEVPVSVVERVPGGYRVPAGAELALVPDELEDAGAAALACAEAGVRVVALLGSGRDRVGARRRREVLEPGVLERIRRAGARVLGPGCRALVNTDPLIRLQVGATGPRVAGGTVAVVTDDAKALDPLRAQLATRGLGVSGIVDVGRGADLGVGDVVDWFALDPRTEVILVSLRGAAPAGLLTTLASVHRSGKPVVLLSGDARATRDASTHDASTHDASTHEVTAPLRATSSEDLADLAMLLAVAGRPRGRRVAVVTNEPWPRLAGANRLLTRLALFGPYLTQHSEMRIHFLIPGSTTSGAVLGLPPDVTAGQLHDVLETLVEDPGVDAVVLEHRPGAALTRRDLRQVLGALPHEGATGRPAPVIVAVDPRGSWPDGAVPVFTGVEQALDTLARACPR
jgi:succinyl-CoA synthetase alpha subunit/N-acetylglutamate synthase-like GNAT family acetyltransferase